MNYSKSDDGLYTKIQLEGNGEVMFRASEIRYTNTGPHARVGIFHDGQVLNYTVMNVDKSEDRIRLVNAAYKQRPTLKAAYKEEAMKHDFDLFCIGLWREHIGQETGGLMMGLEEVPPVEYALRPYIVKGGGTLMYALPGMGKSFMAMLMAVSMDSGIDTLWNVDRMPVMYINIERGEFSMKRRLTMVNQALGLPQNRPMMFMNRRGQSLQDIFPAVKRTVKEKGIKVVFLDSISRAGAGSLVDDQAVNKIVDDLNNLCESWFAIAHTPRGDNTHIYGSVHFEAGCDVGVLMHSQTADDGTIGIGLEVQKANDIMKPPMQLLALEFDSNGLAGVRPAEEGEFPDITPTGKPLTLRGILIQYFNNTGSPATATQISKAIGKDRSSIAGLLTRDATFCRTTETNEGVFYYLTPKRENYS